ncbi:ABC transporter substrate-binding protein [Tessaracoccus sp. OH4464_COT-324]|uniref:ABC transporter substrate-binding protein n=1 Tax=Tessaracoccus sp. OH4464_COT-324 TaxID=2491059 RepID=UPI000F63A24A|nr:ABC transporter substrate-binding protein [Tessaracoccus sp. OH4464_COT-324]RRD45921.1 iron transporter [Tessaracoccus sp. OH4464_COT-324]
MKFVLRTAALLCAPLIALSACSSTATQPTDATSSAGSAASATQSADINASGEISVTNCGKTLSLPGPAKKMYINDGNIIALALAAGAHKEITAVSSLGRDIPVLKQKYGAEVVDGLNEVSKDYPTLESILAAAPDLVVAGWNYGFSEGKNLTPDILKERGIPSYLLTESCRQEGSNKRGIVDPWEAVRIDINNLGAITGHADTAKGVIEDMDQRLSALEKAAKPEKQPVVFVFDSAKDTIFTSGSFGAPNAIIEAAGGVNAAADVDDTWTTVSWEKLATAKPDIIAFVEYPGQSYEDKVQILKEHPVSKDFPAVAEERFVNLPYALWTESPMNIDAAEYLRKAFEQHKLAPESDVKIHLDMPAELPGLGKLPKK